MTQLTPAKRPGLWVAVIWVTTRVPILSGATIMTGDVYYYYQQLSGLASGGPGHVLIEYPTPVVAILTIPAPFSGGTDWGYVLAFIGFALVLDAAFTALLWFTAGRRRVLATGFWILFGLTTGGLLVTRLDILPSLAVAVAIIAWGRGRPGWAGAAIAVGGALKLWPALLILPILALKRDRAKALSGFTATGLSLAGISLLWAGWDRLLSPLSWQSGRGLQIESVWATPPMIARLFSPEKFPVAYAASNSFEISGPGTEALTSAARISLPLAIALLLISMLVWLARGPKSASEGMVLMLLVPTVMACASVVLSPQYILWLGLPAAAMIAITPADRPPAGINQQGALGMVALLLLTSAATQMIFPVSYGTLYRLVPGLELATLALLVRQLLLLIWTTLCLAWWLRVLFWLKPDTGADAPIVTQPEGALFDDYR